MKTAIGGDRLGSGNKQDVHLRNYERSTHDLSYIWRSSMASGTLVPFMNLVALPGDSFAINLNTDVLTLPTIGPLFGSYKVQLDVFGVPVRLYNAKLHMNKLGIGMDMSSIYLPQIKLYANNHTDYVSDYSDNEHINSSCLLKYLGISGLGNITGEVNPAYREFNAVPLLAYWDIYKNYYANKQEEIGYFLHTNTDLNEDAQTPIAAKIYDEMGVFKADCLGTVINTLQTDTLLIIYSGFAQEVDPDKLNGYFAGSAGLLGDHFNHCTWGNQGNYKVLYCWRDSGGAKTVKINDEPSDTLNNAPPQFIMKTFVLDVIDDMKLDILQYTGAGPFIIDESSDWPYGCFQDTYGEDENLKYSMYFSQEGLGIKTYQSDLLNNWINTLWIEGEDSISDITAVSTSAGEFTIDALNLAQKVYIMLNRIAISGGTYDDWLDAVYTEERTKGVDSPVYYGSLIKELGFEEVIGTASTEVENFEPLGQLAGRGKLMGKHKGGQMTIKASEPMYIMGIVSITPRIEYSQGNTWDVNLKTMDDFHKPALDGIGYQDLITEQMAWFASDLDSDTGEPTHYKAGLQPAWINYMTNINRCFGNFADTNKEMFMTLNRRYERSIFDGGLIDVTTYIDPTKFNHIFADTNLDAQNFWVQIAAEVIARRKMSAKIIPNL